MDITAPIRAWAASRPDDIAIVLPSGRELDWASFDATIDAAARRLVAAGIRPGDVVTIPVTRAWRALLLGLAVARAGAVFAPPDHPAGSIAAALVDGPDRASGGRREIVVAREWFEPQRRSPGDAPMPLHDDPDAIAACFPSSGTTGPVKSITVTRAAAYVRIEAMRRCVPVAPRARSLCLASPLSGYGFCHVMRVLHDGGSLVLWRTPADASASLWTHSVEHVAGMPFWIDAVANAVPAGSMRPPALANIEFAGGAMPGALLARLRRRLAPRVHCVYGATEIGCVASGDMEELAAIDGAVGRAVPMVAIDTVDAAGQPLPAGAEGRLRLAGGGLAQGYAGQDDAAFRDGAFVTSDLGCVGADGILRLLGRDSEVIDVGGMRVMPRPIEDALFAVPGVSDAAVIGRPGAGGMPEVWAAIVASSDVDVAAIARTFDALGVVSRPAVIARVARIPRNDAGKVDRRALETALAGHPAGARS